MQRWQRAGKSVAPALIGEVEKKSYKIHLPTFAWGQTVRVRNMVKRVTCVHITHLIFMENTTQRTHRASINTIRSVNAVHGGNDCLLQESYRTQIHTVWTRCWVSTVKPSCIHTYPDLNNLNYVTTFLKRMPNFSLLGWKLNEMKVAEEYCWAITQTAHTYSPHSWRYLYSFPTCPKFDLRRTFRNESTAYIGKCVYRNH